MTEFTDAELANIREMLLQRYRKAVEIHLADSEICLDKSLPLPEQHDKTNMLSCPTVYWQARGAHFIILKIAPYRYRNQFFYTPHDQFGCGIDEYNNLDECVAAVLQTQCDHEQQSDADATQDPKPLPITDI